MSTFAFQTAESPAATDDFAALEQRVLRAIELLKAERASRAAAEEKLAHLHETLDAKSAEVLRLEAELDTHKTERDMVRGRIEKLLGQLDEITF
jgi:chromosome segregation ATPase